MLLFLIKYIQVLEAYKWRAYIWNVNWVRYLRDFFWRGGGRGLKMGILAGLYSININVLRQLTASDEELLQECRKFLTEVLEMVINYPFYNIRMPNVKIPGNMIVEFAGELNRRVSNNPKIKNLLAASLVSTLSEIPKKV